MLTHGAHKMGHVHRKHEQEGGEGENIRYRGEMTSGSAVATEMETGGREREREKWIERKR